MGHARKIAGQARLERGASLSRRARRHGERRAVEREMKIFFYVQHLLGIGHLKRAATLVRAMRACGLDVTLASGGPSVAGLPVDVQLPAAQAADSTFSGL